MVAMMLIVEEQELKNIHKIVSDSLHKQFNISEVVRDNVDCDSQNYIRTNLLTIRGTNSSNIYYKLAVRSAKSS